MHVEAQMVATRQVDQQDKTTTATRCHSPSRFLFTIAILQSLNTMISLIYAIDNKRADLSSLTND